MTTGKEAFENGQKRNGRKCLNNDLRKKCDQSLGDRFIKNPFCEQSVSVVFVLLTVVFAVLFRICGKLDFFPVPAGILRSFCYILLYLFWAISIGQRVMQTQVRRLLTAIALLMVFWMSIRTVKYFFVSSDFVLRQLWYLYYLPMIFIPLLSVFVALSLGNPEKYRLPPASMLLCIPAVLLLAAVLTNDLHFSVFSFPKGEIMSDTNGVYEPMYFAVFGFIVLCGISAFFIIFIKSRVSRKKKYLPAVILLCTIAYAAIYASGVKWMQVIAGDLTAAQCLLFFCILESCISRGLIATNSGYEYLFREGNLGAQIVDLEGKVKYSSAKAISLSPKQIEESRSSTVSVDKNTLLKSNDIPGGRVLWTEDVTAVAELLERLEQNRAAIAESNNLERENYNTKLKINTIREKNRLYDLLQQQTARQIDLIGALLDSLKNENDEQNRKNLLSKVAVVGAYVKRRGNLMFICEKSETVDTYELSLCIGESFLNLELLGVECALDIPSGVSVKASDAVKVYDFFERAIEESIDSVKSVWVKGRNADGAIVICIEIETAERLQELCEFCNSYSYEDGVCRFCVVLKAKSGEGR